MKGIIFDFNRTLYDPDEGREIEGALEVLLRLHKKYLLGLISRGGERESGRIRRCTFSHLFSDIMVQEEKDKEMFVLMSKRLNLPRESIWVVGDRILCEITIGNGLGMKTIWMRTGKFSKESPSCAEEKPFATISLLRELHEIIK